MISVKPPAIDRGLCTLDMPKNAIDVVLAAKRTCPFALQMSAYDPKRTSTSAEADLCALEFDFKERKNPYTKTT